MEVSNSSNTLCRCCLEASTNNNLMNMEQTLFNGSTLTVIFEAITSISAQALSTQKSICQACTSDLTKAYLFKTKAVESHIKLISIKEEYDAELLESGSIKVKCEPFDLPVLVANEIDLESGRIEESNDAGVTYIFCEKRPYGNSNIVRKEKVHRCEQCKKVFTTSQGLIRHKNIHSGTFGYVCLHCNAKFSTSSFLRRHQRQKVCQLASSTASEEIPNKNGAIAAQALNEITVDPTTIPGARVKFFECNHCTYTSLRKANIEIHLLRIHFPHLKHCFCEHCDRAFVRSYDLDRHNEQVHNNWKPYRCDECPNRYLYSTSLKVHKLSHSNVRAFKCKNCNSDFKTKFGLEQHQKANVCELRKAGLRRGFKKKRLFEKKSMCDECGKMIARKLMKCHKRLHTNEMLKCPYCPKEYVYKKGYDYHILSVHSGKGKEEKCHLCASKFFLSAQLRAHLQTVHKLEVPDKRTKDVRQNAKNSLNQHPHSS